MAVARSQQTTISASTTETTIVTADAFSRNDLCSLLITTPNAAVATLTLRDGTAGVTVAVIDYPNAAVIPGTPLQLWFDPPLHALGLNRNWTLQASANAGSVKVTAQYLVTS